MMLTVRTALFLLLATWETGCGQQTRPAENCGTRPSDFRSFSEPDWFGSRLPVEPPHPFQVSLDRADQPVWNGVPVVGPGGTATWAALDRYLAASGELEPVAIVTLTFPRGASCTAIERVRMLMRRHLACAETRRCFQGSPPR